MNNAPNFSEAYDSDHSYLISHTYISPLGPMTIAANDEALCGLWFNGQKHDRADFLHCTFCEGSNAVILDAVQWLDSYFSGKNPDIILNLSIKGSPFRRMILNLLLQIPYGETTTYGSLASKACLILGKDHMSCQAVGNAIGHNPISVIIPCHRVLGANGNLTGYAGGVERKLSLLTLEHVDSSLFFLPPH